MKANKETLAIEQKITRAAFGIAEAAQSLGCHPDTLRRAISDGRVKAIRLSRRVVVTAREMARILAEGF